MIDEPKLKEECGVFGIYGNPEASKLAYLGLYSMQHRGQESCGIVTTDGEKFRKAIGMGKVTDFFSADILETLIGNSAIGHVRYSTAGSSELINAQPIVSVSHRGEIAIAHNGNITNAFKIRKELEQEGAIFQSSSDTEVILHLLARSRKEKFIDALIESLEFLEGAFSLVILTKKYLIAVRDPWGFRPLSLGFIDKGYAIASETAAFDIIEARHIRDIDPGEILIIDFEQNSLRSEKPFKSKKISQCIFELIYFAKPSSMVFEKSVYEFRKQLGRQLAREDNVTPDVVVPIPDSGRMAAIGYAEAKNVRIEEGLIRSHYIGRTFIEPAQRIRDFGAKIKFSPVKSVLEGKVVVLIDDSIVRGTTAKKIIKMVKSGNPKEIHFRISSPPTISPCYYGIDFPSKEELIANQMNIEEIGRYLEVDSLKYLSYDGLFDLPKLDQTRFCSACFNGEYSIEVPYFKKDEMSSLF